MTIVLEEEEVSEVMADPAPPVMVTGMRVKSSPEYVSVLEPGKLASLPPKDSAQTAEDSAREHLK